MKRLSCLLALPIAALSLCTLSGCQLVGGALENVRRDSSHEVKAEYRGLEGKTFAVVIAADRYIQSDHPLLVDYLTTKITDRLAQRTNTPVAGGYIPAVDVLRYLYDNPGWSSKPKAELARGLGGVDRIIYIEITDCQLREPGNQYEWDGVTSGTVAVLEIDTNLPEEYAFQKNISVAFPGKKGFGPDDLSQNAVATALALRFVDRASWLMYDHQEMYYPEY